MRQDIPLRKMGQSAGTSIYSIRVNPDQAENQKKRAEIDAQIKAQFEAAEGCIRKAKVFASKSRLIDVVRDYQRKLSAHLEFFAVRKCKHEFDLEAKKTLSMAEEAKEICVYLAKDVNDPDFTEAFQAAKVSDPGKDRATFVLELKLEKAKRFALRAEESFSREHFGLPRMGMQLLGAALGALLGAFMGGILLMNPFSIFAGAVAGAVLGAWAGGQLYDISTFPNQRFFEMAQEALTPNLPESATDEWTMPAWERNGWSPFSPSAM